MQNRGAIVVIGASAVAATFMIARRLSGGAGSSRRLNRLMNNNLKLFPSPTERLQLQALASSKKKSYLLQGWPQPGTKDDEKRTLITLASYGSAADAEDTRLSLLQAPVANQQPHTLEQHGDVRIDNYYWLRDDERKSKQVINYIKAENEYTRRALADTEPLQEVLYREMRGRVQEADQSAPQRLQGYYYYTRTEEGAQYPVHCRRPIPGNNNNAVYSEADVMDESIPEEILLDENKAAKGHSFYMVGGFEISPNHKLVAYGVDTTGNEMYTLHVKDLTTGAEVLKRPIPETSGSLAWASDNKTLFYVTKDKLDRPYKVWRHTIGTDPKEDVCVFHEEDDAFYIGINLSRTEHVLYLHAGSAVTSDVRYLEADKPTGEWKVVMPRTENVEYSLSDRGDHIFITVRDENRPNNEVLVAPLSDPSNARVVIPHREDVKIEHVEVCKDYLVSFERHQGLQQAVVYTLPADGSMPSGELENGKPILFDEPAYELTAGTQGDFETPVLRFHYTSLTTPDTVIDYNMATGARAVKKVMPVLGGFDKSKYKTERLWATAPDGVQIPISVVYRTDLAKLDGTDPLLLNGYASYEVCNDPDFRSTRLSLIDRGFIFCIAHARGGGEMGRKWYETGKYLQKKNTFTDFIACAEHLISNKYTSPEKLCAEGRSAGGLTMGASVNLRPDLFQAVIFGVPFVDCLTTMLDETIPLTVIEWDEWGNPADKVYYDYMKSYSPVDNLQATRYPNILVTAGLHDPRVGYWEPTKYVAKLRTLKTDNNMLLLKCEMGAGHFSQSGRFDRLKEVAVDFAFLLKCVGMLETPLKPSSA